jgi:aerobic-type carbon monoxide dehydrogenase small subunit (CoxS/CutS family)
VEGTFRVNGSNVTASFASEATLLTVLRAAGHVEVKQGCGEGSCGACLVLLDGQPVNSCQVFAATAMGREIVTVAGLGSVQEPHPVQQAFADSGAVQCGYCTPGMVLAAWALLREVPDPDEARIRRAIDGNYCRCTGYVKIVDAVRLAAKRLAAARGSAPGMASHG